MTITFERLSYAYPAEAGMAPVWALDDVGTAIAEGSFGLLAGPSAGGKSTLLRVVNGLVPQFHGGRMTGRVDVQGLDPSRTPAREMARRVGMVFQEPEAQAVAETVEDEIAFGMEQQGVAQPEMRRRVDALLSDLGIEDLRYRRLPTLSGGERQRVAIAAVLALEPAILLLDEPTSQVDPAGADAVIATLLRLHERRGLTVLIAEHRLERLLPVVDTVLEVESGKVAVMTPREAARRLRAVPAVCELGRRRGWSPPPLTVEEARRFVHDAPLRAQLREGPPRGRLLLDVAGLTVTYGERIALREASFGLCAGEVVALVGANGSGKTTLFRAIAGLVHPAHGTVAFEGAAAPRSVQQRTAHTGLVPQDPAIALYHETVRGEIAETLEHRQTARQRGLTAIDGALEAWDLSRLASANPRDLSVGQQQRVAVATMLAHEPPVWLLDEPTRGADGPAKRWLAERLRAHAAAGGAAIVATHDIESAARYATRVIGLDAGQVVFDLPASTAFAAAGPVPTQVARLVPGARVAEDVI